jgi:hypothetical protein
MRYLAVHYCYAKIETAPTEKAFCLSSLFYNAIVLERFIPEEADEQVAKVLLPQSDRITTLCTCFERNDYDDLCVKTIPDYATVKKKCEQLKKVLYRFFSDLGMHLKFI